MKTGIVLWLCSFWIAMAPAHATNYLDAFSPEEIERAHTAKDDPTLSTEEKEVFLYLNLARMYPKRFRESVVIPFIEAEGWTKSSYYRSLLSDLNKAKQAPPLEPRKDLYAFARKHALDMGKTGKLGHRSSRGESFAKRIKPLQSTYVSVGENCQYGFQSGLRIVLDLLVDEGIADVSHRVNSLNPEFLYMGVSIEPHKKYQWNCVQEFAGALK
ncbi:MAG: CAP domain-containing protein [Leptolyngbya sp. SIO3F4]|nr:CAP domain-containing protein [Leptolyngbya sp. SIO3F4]